MRDPETALGLLALLAEHFDDKVVLVMSRRDRRELVDVAERSYSLKRGEHAASDDIVVGRSVVIREAP
jgi:hypothetical protein